MTSHIIQREFISHVRMGTAEDIPTHNIYEDSNKQPVEITIVTRSILSSI